ncbi:MAG: hypothetical protein CL930_11655 [Deltaproteobacteria bacterium]|nr:hypothetical protein [Deltaproteobacteria bacterium]
MSSYSHQQQSSSGTDQEIAPTQQSGGAGTSNAQLAEQTATAKGASDGLQNYQAALGQWLGKELYEAIAPHLTHERMAAHANSALMAAFDAVLDMGDLDKKSSEEFSKAFEAQFGQAAGNWLQGDGKDFAASLSDWVGANPHLIVTAALLAAAGAYMANAPIPELSQKLKLGDSLTAELGAKLGKLRDISLQEISLKLSTTTDLLVGAVKVGVADGTTTTEVNAKLGGDERSLSANALMVGDDLQVLGLTGLLKNNDYTLTGGAEHKTSGTTIKANLTREDGNTQWVDEVSYNADTGILTVGNAFSQTEDGNTFKYSESGSTDGSGKQTLSMSSALTSSLTSNFSLEESAKRLGASDSYALTENQKASFGLNYDTKDLDAKLNLSLDTEGNNSASGSIDRTWGSGYSAGGNAKTNWGNKDYLEAGAYFGFRDPDEFTTYMGKYKYTNGPDVTHTVDMMLEKKLGPVYTRLQQRVNYAANVGVGYETTAQGAYYLNDDIAVIGGAQYKGGAGVDDSIAPQLGIQIKGVPLIVTHDPSNDTTTVGITLKFGR